MVIPTAMVRDRSTKPVAFRQLKRPGTCRPVRETLPIALLDAGLLAEATVLPNPVDDIRYFS